MQHVPIKWLHRFNLFLVVLDVLIFVFYFLFDFTGASERTVSYWGITPVILVIAGVHFVYSMVIYPLTRRFSEWITYAVSQMIFGILFAAIIETSGNTNLWYRLGFAAWVFFLNLIGPYPAIAAAALAWILVLFDVTQIATGTESSLLFNVVIDTIVTIAAVGGWFFFRRHYELDSSTKEAAAGLVNKEKIKTDFILGSMADGVVLIDPDGIIQYINPAASNITGWSQHDVVGLDYDAVLKFYDTKQQPYPETQHPLHLAAMKGEAVRNNNILYKTKSDKVLTLTVDAAPLLDDSGGKTGGLICIFRDVSKERVEEQRRADFISTASHEMRTPVAAIEGYLALAMNNKVCVIDEKARGYLAKAHASTQHLGQLFQDLLTSAKADDGRLSNHPEVVEIGGLLEQLVEDLRFTAEKKNLGIEFVMGSDDNNVSMSHNTQKTIKPLYYAFVDPHRLQEVITNLFDNAVKYTSAGKVTIGLTGNADVIQFYIKDTGNGIPPEDVPHLFQKFYRVDNSATRTIGGTGLGLFICRKIIELYNGRIWVESALNEGSTFFVNLPRLSMQKVESLQAEQQRTISQPALTDAPVQPASQDVIK